MAFHAPADTQAADTQAAELHVPVADIPAVAAAAEEAVPAAVEAEGAN